MKMPSTPRKISATSPVEFQSWTKMARQKSCQFMPSTLRISSAQSWGFPAQTASEATRWAGLWTNSSTTDTNTRTATLFLCTNLYKSSCSPQTPKKFMESKSRQLTVKLLTRDSSRRRWLLVRLLGLAQAVTLGTISWQFITEFTYRLPERQETVSNKFQEVLESLKLMR